MTIEVDTSRPLRGSAELRMLVEAVTSAAEHDESHWIEWKSSLDLSTKEGCFAIARTVLGMANRLPQRAALVCGGLGFIIVGASPAGIEGIVTSDPAHVDQVLELYLGGSLGPSYTTTYLAVDGKSVLVVVVEPPVTGDRIFTLRKELVGERSGTIFVRKTGRTVVAEAADVDALQNRASATGAPASGSIEISAVGPLPLAWVDERSASAAIAQWSRSAADELIDKASAVEAERKAFERSLGADSIDPKEALAAIDRANMIRRRARRSARLGIGEEEDGRTFDEFVAEAGNWAEELTEAAIESLPGAATVVCSAELALEVRNGTGRYLHGVEVVVRFDPGVVLMFDERPDVLELPDPPYAFGESVSIIDRLAVARYDLADLSRLADMSPAIRRRTWVTGDAEVTFELGDLRQQYTVRSDDVYLFLRRRPDDGVLHGEWTASVRDMEGLLTGELTVPVDELPLDNEELLIALAGED